MSELDELMAERVQMLEEALRRAVAGIASSEDWILIYHECGVINQGKQNEFDSQGV